jgi:hypothetical protein
MDPFAFSRAAARMDASSSDEDDKDEDDSEGRQEPIPFVQPAVRWPVIKACLQECLIDDVIQVLLEFCDEEITIDCISAENNCAYRLIVDEGGSKFITSERLVINPQYRSGSKAGNKPFCLTRDRHPLELFTITTSGILTRRCLTAGGSSLWVSGANLGIQLRNVMGMAWRDDCVYVFHDTGIYGVRCLTVNATTGKRVRQGCDIGLNRAHNHYFLSLPRCSGSHLLVALSQYFDVALLLYDGTWQKFASPFPHRRIIDAVSAVPSSHRIAFYAWTGSNIIEVELVDANDDRIRLQSMQLVDSPVRRFSSKGDYMLDKLVAIDETRIGVLFPSVNSLMVFHIPSRKWEQTRNARLPSGRISFAARAM